MTAPPPVAHPWAPIERVLCWVLGSLCALWFLGWLPQYLTWPWWIDLDTYAWLAQGWTSGTVPYRDVQVFNFPGQIYLFWVLGTVFGWGRTASIYAVDAALLAGLIALLLTWSRSRLGTRLPAWFAATSLLSYYLNQEYHLVAQRDWQASILAVASLLLVQLGRSRRLTRAFSAVALGAAFTIRPHVVLLSPAIALAVWLEPEPVGAAPAKHSGRWRGLLTWSCLFAASVLVGFLPLIVSGLLGDLVAAIRLVGYGSHYAQLARPGLLRSLALQIGRDRFPHALRSPSDFGRALDLAKLGLLLFLNLGWLTRTRNGPLRNLAAPWALGLGLLFLYEPLHPIRHAYLAHPLRVIWAVNLALFVAVGWPTRTQGRPRRYHVLTLLFAGLMAWLPGWPRFWSPLRSLEAWPSLVRNELPARVPLGARVFFAPEDSRSPYRWEEYRQAIDYLRRTTDASTRVANLLRNVPFPAINGPVGRVSPLTAEGAIPYLYTIDAGIETEFAQALERAPVGTVVVWDPSRPAFTTRLDLELVAAVVRKQYRPEAQFGIIEIWRKRAEARGQGARSGAGVTLRRTRKSVAAAGTASTPSNTSPIAANRLSTPWWSKLQTSSDASS